MGHRIPLNLCAVSLFRAIIVILFSLVCSLIIVFSTITYSVHSCWDLASSTKYPHRRNRGLNVPPIPRPQSRCCFFFSAPQTVVILLCSIQFFLPCYVCHGQRRLAVALGCGPQCLRLDFQRQPPSPPPACC